ncbi:glycosyltransferase family 2 protein [Marinagarivorans cellulosilyticus]|uniref:Glycosyltransferase n=1 Tax=Marinagarivorans cellulosilyticus TaxID=2721545 RepID=A0AAN2BKJ6_9GAMM|nr:glycosyltransferase family 2 protein [Marinagarivorans cellulosilyticus]BCD98057.1 hypothetical protein MARGE09_P2258 [Marinagarivorans cellulosilyticus]
MTILLIAFVLILCVPSYFLSLEIVLGVFLGRRSKGKTLIDEGDQVSSVILIPAHNEESIIAETLLSLTAELTPNDRVVIVADNCSDSTAKIAKSFNFTVLERTNSQCRGKGFALAHGVSFLEEEGAEVDVVVVLDADCVFEAGSLRQLILCASRKQAPVQGSYLLHLPEGSKSHHKVSEFAIYIKNHVRPAGLASLGGSVPITGSGFAVPFHLLRRVSLASGEIVEDMKLGVDLMLQGYGTAFCPQATIRSLLPLTQDVADGQRKRWEHGHLSVIARYFPRLFSRGLFRANTKLIFTALDFSVLPLVFLLAVNSLLLLFFLLFAVLLNSWVPFLIILGAQLFVLLSLFVANVFSRPRYLKITDAFYALRFIAGKVTVYTALVSGKKSSWVKTQRDKH